MQGLFLCILYKTWKHFSELNVDISALNTFHFKMCFHRFYWEKKVFTAKACEGLAEAERVKYTHMHYYHAALNYHTEQLYCSREL